MSDDLVVLTIGHSTHSLDAFISLLQAHAVERVVDVRSVPRSRRNPQFNRETLPGSLADAGMDYSHLPELGGLRKPREDSPNGGWRVATFRGYADYTLTPEFAAAIDALLALARAQRVAVMCAEAVYWRCHRRLIADALLARGIRVEHIISERKREPHALTEFALIEGTRITYPPA